VEGCPYGTPCTAKGLALIVLRTYPQARDQQAQRCQGCNQTQEHHRLSKDPATLPLLLHQQPQLLTCRLVYMNNILCCCTANCTGIKSRGLVVLKQCGARASPPLNRQKVHQLFGMAHSVHKSAFLQNFLRTSDWNELLYDIYITYFAFGGDHKEGPCIAAARTFPKPAL
jgi:hypothetical protein